MWPLTLLSLVSCGTLGIQSLREEKAVLMDWVLRLSFFIDPTILPPPLFSDRWGPRPSPAKNTQSWNTIGDYFFDSEVSYISMVGVINVFKWGSYQTKLV